jgi:hypothetical protein
MDALAAIDFVTPVLTLVRWVLFIFAAVIEVAAFVHCLMQRPDAFRAVGTLSKGLWLLLTGGGVFITVCVLSNPVGILGLIGITAAAVYLLDVRPAIKEASGGSSGW